MAQAFSYVTRTLKTIERNMIADVLVRLSHVLPLHEYMYVGFGALEFVDLELMRRRLRVKKLVSIEKAEHPRQRERFEFNKPFGHIDLVFGEVSDRLPSLGLEELDTILWLDYEDSLGPLTMKGIVDSFRRLRVGSILVATVNAEPPKDGARRLQWARDEIGQPYFDAFLPDEPSPSDLGRRGMSEFQAAVLSSLASDSISSGRSALPVMNLRYRDGAQMQTMAWVVTDDELEDQIRAIDWSDIEFVADCLEHPQHVATLKAPTLTSRERLWLDKEMPLEDLDHVEEIGLVPSWATQYQAVHSWYPRYVEAVRSA